MSTEPDCVATDPMVVRLRLLPPRLRAAHLAALLRHERAERRAEGLQPATTAKDGR